MKTLIATALLAFAACHHDAAPQNPTTGAGTETADSDPDVDPTLPSWAPPSCRGYHAWVVKFSACNEIEQAARDQVAATYDADNKKWHDMTNATAADLDQVKVSCGESRASVKSQMTGKCTNMVGTQQPTQ
ncbi:MAG: hypothetical protein ABI678_03425 [Kofleriaceae bacterium]